MTVTTAVRSQDRVIKRSVAYRSLKHATANTPAQARKLITEFSALRRKVEHAATVVSRASASSARQRRGRTDWVTGARDLGRGIGQLDTGLKDVVDHRTTAGKAMIKKAARTLAVADAIGSKADRLLGIPRGD